MPLYRSTVCVSTPGSRGFLRADGASRRLLFRPRGFSPPRRFPPRRGCGSVAPRCRLWSSTRFPSRLPGHPRVSCKSFAFPAPRVIPFEEFPSSAAVPHHCGRCPPAIAARNPRPDLLDLSRARRRPCSRSCRAGAGALSRAEALVSAPRPVEPKLSWPWRNLSGRGRRGCVPSLAEAGVGECSPLAEARMAPRVVGGRGHLRRGSPDLRGGPTNGPDCPATEAAVRPPRGPIHLTDRGRCGVYRSPRWAAESKSRCAALVMLRSAEADPHVTNRALRAGRRADLLRPRRASFRGPKVLVRRESGTTLQSVARPAEPRRPKPCDPDPATAPKRVAPSRAPVARHLRQRRSGGTADFRALLR